MAISQSTKYTKIIRDLSDDDLKSFLTIVKCPEDKISEIIKYYREFAGKQNTNPFVAMSIFSHAVAAHKKHQVFKESVEFFKNRVDPILKIVLESVENYAEVGPIEPSITSAESSGYSFGDFCYNLYEGVTSFIHSPFQTTGRGIQAIGNAFHSSLVLAVSYVPFKPIVGLLNNTLDAFSSGYSSVVKHISIGNEHTYADLLATIASKGLNSLLTSSYTPYAGYSIKLQFLMSDKIEQQASSDKHGNFYQAVQFWKKDYHDIAILGARHKKIIKQCASEILDNKKCTLPAYAVDGPNGVKLTEKFNNFITQYHHLLKSMSDFQSLNKQTEDFSHVSDLASELEDRMSDFMDSNKVLDSILIGDFAFFDKLKDFTTIGHNYDSKSYLYKATSNIYKAYKMVANYATYNIENDFEFVKYSAYSSEDLALYIDKLKNFAGFVKYDLSAFKVFYTSTNSRVYEYYTQYNVGKNSKLIEEFSVKQVEYYKTNAITSVLDVIKYYKDNEFLTKQALSKAQIFAYLEVLQDNMHQLQVNFEQNNMLKMVQSSEKKLEQLQSDHYAVLVDLINKNHASHNEQYFIDLIKYAEQYCYRVQQFLDGWLVNHHEHADNMVS